MEQVNSQPPAEAKAGHETTDASAGALAKVVVGFVICGALVLAIVWRVYVDMERSQEASDTAAGMDRSPLAPSAPPEPRLQPSPFHTHLPFQDAQELHRQGDSTLASYGWVDRDAGRVRIPIDRAESLLADRGLTATLPAVHAGPVPATAPASPMWSAPTTPVEGGP